VTEYKLFTRPFTVNPFQIQPDEFRTEEEKLRYQLKQANDTLNRTREKPQLIGTVGCVLPGQRGMVFAMNGQMSLKLPDGCKAGAQVSIAAESNSILEVLPAHVNFGPVVTVAGKTGHDVMYDQGMLQQTAFLPSTISARVGDKVQLDPTGKVVLRNVGNEEPSDYVVHKSPGVSWDDIGGHEEAKEALREAIEYPIRYAEAYKAYGQKPTKGVLLYGPPGTGKTMLGKAVATALAVDGDSSGFIYVKAAEVLNRFVGASEAAVRGLFARARAHKEKTGNPAVLFIDEADALLGTREGQGLTMAITQTLVPMFLAEMDGLDESGCFVMLSTNRPDSLDPAIVRDGRIDRKIRIGRPDAAATKTIMALALRGRHVDSSVDELAEYATQLLHSETATLYELQFRHGAELIRLRDALNGALVTGIVNRATRRALQRHRATGEATGLIRYDIQDAVRESYAELLASKLTELVIEKCDAMGGAQPGGIEKRPGRIE